MQTENSDKLPKTKAIDPNTQAAQIMAGIGQASYVWNLLDDSLSWSDNFVELVGLAHRALIDTGRNFEKLLSAESPQTRYGTVLSAETEALGDEGVPYQCLYAINAANTNGDMHVWIEDSGRWYPSESGKPVRAEGVVRVANERRKREESLRMKSDFDDLTGMPNRRFMQETLDRVISNCFTNDSNTVFMLFSLERLELINATYGFATGDEVLKQVAKILQANLRGGDMIARFSGAKFGLILHDCGPGEVFIAAKRFLSFVEQNLIKTERGPVALRGNIGACLLPKHAQKAEEAVAAAMFALEDAKNEGSLRISVYDPDPEVLAKKQSEAILLTEVIDALEEGRMRLAYQPVVDAQNHSVSFHESLLRMEGTDGSLSAAASFVGTAEKLGLIRFVDHHAQRLTLTTLENFPDAVLSLNVSHETAAGPEWISSLASALRNNTGIAERLIVEITESHAAGDILEAQKFVNMIKDLG